VALASGDDDGSLAHTGTTIVPGADGETIELKGQTMAGYITTRSGRRGSYALMVNAVYEGVR
jgi:hypothetical protein